MATSAAAAAGTKTRKTPIRANGRGPSNFINSSNIDNSVEALRIQRVIAVAGVSPVLASIIAPLAFGGAA